MWFIQTSYNLNRFKKNFHVKYYFLDEMFFSSEMTAMSLISISCENELNNKNLSETTHAIKYSN